MWLFVLVIAAITAVGVITIVVANLQRSDPYRHNETLTPATYQSPIVSAPPPESGRSRSKPSRGRSVLSYEDPPPPQRYDALDLTNPFNPLSPISVFNVPTNVLEASQSNYSGQSTPPQSYDAPAPSPTAERDMSPPAYSYDPPASSFESSSAADVGSSCDAGSCDCG